MKKRSLLCILLVFAMSLCLFSCVAGKDGSSKDISKEVQSDIKDDYVLKDKDLNEAEIRFLVPDSSYVYYESFDIYADELGEGVINDAVYERNMQIEDKYKNNNKDLS